ncbi:MAG TPA: glycosyltransferase [Bryobacteraceae bacterium]|jgi:glycosyltransferase involved in cell wall biosynthesis|nr:glycosyltransferase [Bryobacteraceae bacterium]
MNPITTKPGGDPIRILYIIDTLGGEGGAELSLLRLIRHLPPERFRCRVITFHNRNPEFLKEFPCRVDHWELKRVYGWRAAVVAAHLRNIVRRDRIDIVHSFFPTSDLWAAPIARACGARILISSRRDMGIVRAGKHRLLYRALQGMFDQIQAVSEAVRQFTIQADGVDPARAVTIHNGVEPWTASVCARDPSRVRIACIANWRPVKGIDVLVRAAAKVGSRDDRALFWIAGNPGAGEYRREVESLCRSLGADRWIHFLGASPQARDLLERSDLFVLPSRSEGLSNALLEAMQSGLACVASDAGGNSEVVVHGTTGLLFPAGDDNALAEKILELMANPARRERMGGAGRKRVAEQFSVKAMVERVMTSYETLLEKKAAGARSGTSRRKVGDELAL